MPKLRVFGWFLLSDRLNTRNMLKRRHYNIGDNTDCLLCGDKVEETVEHLFFHCRFSQVCWRMLQIQWGTSGHRLDLIQQQKERWRHKMFMEVFLVSSWSLWKERNNHHFRNITPTVASWRDRFKLDLSNLRFRVPPHKAGLIEIILDSLP